LKNLAPLLVLLAFFAVGLVSEQTVLAAPAKAGGPSAQKELKAAFKSLVKAKSYSVQASVLGGLAKNNKHKVAESTVNTDYKGHVFGSSKKPVMHIPSRLAYKTPKVGGGAIKTSGAWKRILSSKEGLELDKLVDFPTLILAEAVKFSKTARWLDKSELPDGWADDLQKKKKKKKKKSKKKKSEEGTTTVRKKKDKAKKVDASRPTVLRVEAPRKKALDIWVKRVENSGCMKSG
jgi:hypothetical protein